ncbi:MAG TPA: NHL repeat-containing protein [Candidatus Acidoferrales bacterium]|nr:NHL repeat-containing protein [Candidatus Acidoferrales bacterium]
MAQMNSDSIRSRFPYAALFAIFFLVSCGNRANPAVKPQAPPPPPFEFLGSWGDKGEGPGKLDAPVAFASDALGNIFFADPAIDYVHKFESKGTPLLSFEDPRLRHAAGISIDAGGAIYVVDPQLGNIHVFFPDGTFFQSWHVAPQRHFSGPVDVGIDEVGTIYSPDFANSRIQKFNNHGRLVTSWPAPQKPVSPEERPSWVAAEPDNAIFVAYFNTGRVEKFSPEGTSIVSWPAGDMTAENSGVLSALAVNTDFVFTMGASSSEIRVWDTDGRHKLDADLTANLGKIAAPQLAITPHGELLVFDPSAQKVFRFRIHLPTKEPL